MFQIPVERDEGVEFISGQCQEFAIALAALHPICLTVETSCPTNRLLSCIGTDSSSSSLISNTLQDIPRHIKRPYCLLTAYTWEFVQKFVQTVPTRQIVKQILYWYAVPTKMGVPLTKPSLL